MARVDSIIKGSTDPVVFLMCITLQPPGSQGQGFLLVNSNWNHYSNFH